MPGTPAGRHKLLERQIRRHLGAAGTAGLDALLDAVEAAYRQADDDRALLGRSLELTSQELLEQNRKLREELDIRTTVEESLRRSLVRLDEAQRVARLGYWETNVRDGSAFWSDQTYRIFGFEPGTVTPSFGLFVEMVSEESLVTLATLVRKTWGGETHEIVLPITRADGEVRTLRASGEVVRDAEGRVTQIHGVCVDVTDEEEQRRELVRAKERAEELLRLKTSLLNNMSHELRTPLTGILGYAELLGDEVVGESQDMVDAILRGGRRLMDTLNSVLDLAQLESGSFHLQHTPLDARAEVADVLTLLAPLAHQKGIALSSAAGADAVWCQADRAALFRVLNNVVGNAVKFTEVGGVTVAVEPVESGEVRVRVTDTGVGISPEFLPRLFEEFRQASDGYGRQHEGNGLGLAITHRLVHLLGGRLDVRSALGEGSVFEVFLPGGPGPTETLPAPDAVVSVA